MAIERFVLGIDFDRCVVDEFELLGQGRSQLVASASGSSSSSPDRVR